jgi:hypothetical protein
MCIFWFIGSLKRYLLSIQNPIIKPTTSDAKHITGYFGNTKFVRTIEQKQIMQQKIKEIIHKE